MDISSDDLLSSDSDTRSHELCVETAVSLSSPSSSLSVLSQDSLSHLSDGLVQRNDSVVFLCEKDPNSTSPESR